MKLIALILAIGLVLTTQGFANGTLKEKAKETYNDSVRGMKKAGRAVKDQACELVNGKMECLGEKMKSSVKNATDKMEDALD